MNWKRAAKKAFVPLYNTKDLVSKVKDYGVIDGIKEKVKEDFLEDTPIISHIYNAGKGEGEYIGKKEGYVRASNEYEEKLLKQAKEFLNQQNTLKMKDEEKDQLLDEYEAYIEELERAKESLSTEKKAILAELKAIRSELLAMGEHRVKELGESKIVLCGHCSTKNRVNIAKVNEANFMKVKCGQCKSSLFSHLADLEKVY